MTAPGALIEAGDSGRADARSLSTGGTASLGVYGGRTRTSDPSVIDVHLETEPWHQGGYKTETIPRAQTTTLESPGYFAAIRRRGAASIKTLISRLAELCDDPNFAVHTYPITREINRLVGDLIDARFEGNSREILRRLRNSILDGGWERYRAPEVRRGASSILDFFEEADTVIPSDVKRMTEAMRQVGLNPYAAPILQYEPDGAPEDGEAEVLD